MNQNQLGYFVSVVEENGFSTAARARSVTVQAISKSIAELERELGAMLFVRTPRGITPTDYCRSFYPCARRAVDAFEEACSFSAEIAAGEALNPASVHLTFGVCTPIVDGSETFRKLFTSYFGRSIRSSVDFEMVLPEEGIKRLREGDFDGLVTIGEVEQEGLTSNVLGTLPCGISVSRRHPLAKKQSVTIDDIKGFPAGESSTWDNFTKSILVNFRDSGLIDKTLKVEGPAEALEFFGERNGFFFSAILPYNKNSSPLVKVLPIEDEGAPRASVCLVVSDTAEGPRRASVENFMEGTLRGSNLESAA